MKVGDGRIFYCMYSDCDYKATKNVSVKRHIEAKHEGIVHQCNLCDHRSTRIDHFNEHLK